MNIERLTDTDLVLVTTEVIDVAQILAAVEDPRAGGIAFFLGTVRDHAPGKTGVTHLEYEAYGGVVEDKIAEIVVEARAQWRLHRIAAVHRVGSLGIGEISVAVAASATHRKDAFPAARFLIDELKSRAPIWKKEHWSGGAEWVR
ncbi:MAG: molybdenum cofactor biosynthesis protein MoaE, partial [Acidimicrobiia bacterium]|nr:molybdenum cofactor biosynthesis protein MoaE [Acidimicrobiia bacterium]